MLVTPTSCKIFNAAPDAQGVIRWSCVTPTPTQTPTNFGHLIMLTLPRDPSFPTLLLIAQFLPIVLVVISVICFSLAGIIIFLKIKYFRKTIKNEQVLLEITPPANNTQSARSTEELFKKLHMLASQGSRIEGLIGYKKTYALELVSTKEKGIRYLIRTNRLDSKVIKSTIISYLPDAKVRTVEEYLPQNISETAGIWNIYELHLANNFALPLKEQTTLSQHDPIAFITGHMTKLKPNEIVVMQVIITPILQETHKNEVNKISELDTYIYNNLDISNKLRASHTNIIFSFIGKLILWYIKIWMFCVITPFTLIIGIFTGGAISPIPLWIFFGGKNKQASELSEQQKHINNMVSNKIAGELYETSVRLYVNQQNSSDFSARIKGLVSSFASFNNDYYQQFTFHPPFRFVGFLKKWAFFKLHHRLLSLQKNPIVSVAELSALYHFPYTTTAKTENLVTVHSPELPAPLSLKQANELDVVFGVNSYGGENTKIGLTDDERSRHVYLIGQTGSGKSTVMFHMAKDDIQNGRGVAVVDPHGDLIEDLLTIVPEKRIDDFIYFNPFDLKHPIGINLLEIPDNLDEDELELEKELVTEGVISIFRRVFSNEEQGNAHRIEYILRNAIYTSFYVEDRTIFTIYSLLNDSAFRKQVVAKVDDENLLSFWKNEFNKAGNYQIVKMVSGVTAKVGRFLFSPTAKRILGQTKSTINFDDILESGKILLCNLSEGKLGEDTSQLFGTTIITKLQQAAYRRARKDKKDRKPFYLFIDEFQNFATSSFTKLLSGGRKFGIRVTIAEQSTAQQKDKDVTNVILANTGTVICFKTASPIDEELLLPQFSPYVDKGEIMNLPRYHFYIKLGALEPEEPFSSKTLPMEIEQDQELISKLIASSQDKYASTYVKKEKPKAIQKETSKEKQVQNSDKSIGAR